MRVVCDFLALLCGSFLAVKECPCSCYGRVVLIMVVSNMMDVARTGVGWGHFSYVQHTNATKEKELVDIEPVKSWSLKDMSFSETGDGLRPCALATE